MFGKNEVASAFRDPEGTLLVNDMFYTIQGEGPDSGCPAVFIRLAKCNLRCYFCDTEFETGKVMTVTQIHYAVMEMIRRNNCRLVVVTGGEPLLQNIVPLTEALNVIGVRVSIETAGTVWGDEYFEAFGLGKASINKIICSPKTSALNRFLVEHVSAWKYIISVLNSSPVDGLPWKSTQVPGQGHPMFRPHANHPAPIYVQPMDEQNVVLNDANMKRVRDIAMQFGYRVSLQTHKILGVP